MRFRVFVRCASLNQPPAVSSRLPPVAATRDCSRQNSRISRFMRAQPSSLPQPRRERWQPLRSGFVNLYRYDREEFHYENGRLLLRGNNGTGKSRMLALQLPFLLDGDTSPERLEP